MGCLFASRAGLAQVAVAAIAVAARIAAAQPIAGVAGVGEPCRLSVYPQTICDPSIPGIYCDESIYIGLGAPGVCRIRAPPPPPPPPTFAGYGDKCVPNPFSLRGNCIYGL